MLQQDEEVHDDVAAAAGLGPPAAAPVAMPPAAAPAPLPPAALPMAAVPIEPFAPFAQPLGNGLKHAAENPQVRARVLGVFANRAGPLNLLHGSSGAVCWVAVRC